MKEKTVLRLDMDGVLADFYNSPTLDGEKRGYGNYPEMYEVGFFRNLPVIPGAREAVTALLECGLYDISILTQPVKESAHSYSEKVEWIAEHFPELSNHIIMTQDKSELSRAGDLLMDDNIKWSEGWNKHGGLFLHFDEDTDPVIEWDLWLEYLTPQTKPKNLRAEVAINA